MSALAEMRALGLTPEQVERLYVGLVRDKGYQEYPLGQDAATYLRHKRKRLTDSSYREYESTLDKLCRGVRIPLTGLEPPDGTLILEEFMDRQWGEGAARSYNRHHSILHDFFKFHIIRRNLHGDPMLGIERAKTRGVYRTTFTPDQRRAVLAQNHDLRDRIALRLLFDYGLRNGSVRDIQFRHFDHLRKRLTIFAKGGKVRNVPIPDPAFWDELGRLIIESEAQPHWYLLPTNKGNQNGELLVHDVKRGATGMHYWWYRCLARAGVVAEGSTSGERMHKARHTAGQRLLDHTGNLKAVQQLLGHASITTTGDVYVGWDEAALAASLESMLDTERHDD